MSHDVVVIGGGHNGLITATLLAKAGLNTVVLERRDTVGGCALSTDIAPGFRCPTLTHAIAIDARVVKALDLARHGLEVLPAGSGRVRADAGRTALVLWRDTARAAEEIRGFSPKDADQYPRFVTSFERISGVLRAVATTRRPTSTIRERPTSCSS